VTVGRSWALSRAADYVLSRMDDGEQEIGGGGDGGSAAGSSLAGVRELRGSGLEVRRDSSFHSA